jgi:glycosyltransferase involved in cell wall biosynthesis
MKVAMIGLRGIPSKDGGVEVAVGELAPLLVKEGLSVSVYCRTNYSDKNLKVYDGVKLIHYPTINSKHLEAFVHTFISTMDAICKRFDIIHYHADGNALFCWIPRLFGSKTIVTLHGQDWHRDKWGRVPKFILKLGEHIGVYVSNNTISVSNKIVNYYKGKKLTHIPNGIPVVDIERNNHILNKFNIKNYILYLGRLVPEKGVHLLINAYNELDLDEQLVIVGDVANTSDYLDELKILGNNNNKIIFTGAIYGSDKQTLIKNAKLFVMPSLLEGMPIVLLEILNEEIPCLVSDIPEILEVVNNDNKFCATFSSGNSSDLKLKLSYSLSNIEMLQKKAKSGKFFINSKYNWELIATQTIQVYYS